MLLIVREPATPEQTRDMLETFGSYIKLAVDVEPEVIAGGGGSALRLRAGPTEHGSHQEDVWGADWDETGEVRYESLINIRPKQNNPGLEVQSPLLRQRISAHHVLSA